jgi:hypothetical protein
MLSFVNSQIWIVGAMAGAIVPTARDTAFQSRALCGSVLEWRCPAMDAGGRGTR